MSTSLDTYSGQHTMQDPAALLHYERAVRDLAAHKPIMQHLRSALALAPAFPAALALQGFAGAMSGRASGLNTARELAAETRNAVSAAGGGTPFERALSTALDAASAGRLKRAAHHLEEHLSGNPRNLLALKLAHGLRFMSGQAGEMERTTASTIASWSPDMPGFGFVLGCRAFALEECGELREAEIMGRRAVAHEPEDFWGLHAVAHVMEMSGRTREGRAWLGAARQRWNVCGGFGQHLVWHLALFHLSDGDCDGALALYDAGIQPARDGDFRDFSNAVALLWRLEQHGVDVGERWDTLHGIAHERRLDSSYAFAALHNLMALVGASDENAARECLAQMRRRARGDANDQATVLARVGVPLGELMLSAHARIFPRGRLETLARDLPLLGGSRAQQDLFLRSLLVLAAQSGDAATLDGLCEIRSAQRAEDRLQASLLRRHQLRRRTIVRTAGIEIREAS